MTATNKDWYKPSVLKRLRLQINAILIVIAGLIVYMQHNWLIKILHELFK